MQRSQLLTSDAPISPQPRLIAVVDTEEEFDWSKAFSREATSVANIGHIGRLQQMYDRFSVEPTYVVDYPIATQERGWRPLRNLLEAGRASIGAHLHPWVTPPFREQLCARNSYGGNLDRELECAKILALTERVEQSFGLRPRVFKAGRFGIGQNTFSILSELGYEADLSPAPPQDCSEDGGPDYTAASCRPFRDPATGLLVIPGTGAFAGWLPRNRSAAHRWAASGWRRKLRAQSLLWRAGAARRIWLSPESFSAEDMISLTRLLYAEGQRTFVVSLHSSVMLPGATAFAPDEQGVAEVLARLQRFFRFFFGEFGGKPWTVEAELAGWPESEAASGLEPSWAGQVT